MATLPSFIEDYQLRKIDKIIDSDIDLENIEQIEFEWFIVRDAMELQFHPRI